MTEEVDLVAEDVPIRERWLGGTRLARLAAQSAVGVRLLVVVARRRRPSVC
jgi:hypothetical protein